MNFIKKYFVEFLLFIGTLSVYIFTLAPTVTFGDSGEFISVAHTLGIAHPPGYSLWILLGRIFSLLPLGFSVAAKINFSSALFTAVAVFFLYLLIKELIEYYTEMEFSELALKLVAASASLFFAFTLNVWSNAIVTEVYALNSLFVALVIYLLFLWYSRQNYRYLLACSYFFGLGLANHQTLGLILPTAGILTLIVLLKEKALRAIWVPAFLLFVLGFTANLYLIARSLANPELNWGGLDSFNKFLNHILRDRYPKANLLRPFDLFIRQLSLYYKEISYEFLFLPLLIALWGIIDLFRKDKLWGFFFILSILITSTGTVLVENFSLTQWFEIEGRVFLLPAFILISIVFGLGLWKVVEKLKFADKKWVNLVWLILPLILILVNYNPCDKRGTYFARDYGEKILADIEENGTILTVSDYASFPLLYLGKVEKLRPDVILLQSNNLQNAAEKYYERVDEPALVCEALDNLSFHPEYVSEENPVYCELNVLTFPVAPFLRLKNFAYEVNPTPVDSFPPEEISGLAEMWINYVDQQMEKKQAKYDVNIRGAYSYMLNQLGYYFDGKNRIDLSLKFFQKAIAINPTQLRSYYNLSIVYSKLGQTRKALEQLQFAISIDPYFPEANYQLGLYHETKGEIEEALEHYERAQIFAFEKTYITKHLADIYFMRGEYKKAEKIYKNILEANPQSPEIHEKLGLVYFDARRFSMALYHFKIAAREPGRITTFMKIGDIRLLVEQYKEAVKWYQKVLELDEDNTQALTKLALAYNYLGNHEKEKELLDRTLQIDPTNARGWLGLACYYSAKNERVEFYRTLKKALELGGVRAREIIIQEKCFENFSEDAMFKEMLRLE